MHTWHVKVIGNNSVGWTIFDKEIYWVPIENNNSLKSLYNFWIIWHTSSSFVGNRLMQKGPIIVWMGIDVLGKTNKKCTKWHCWCYGAIQSCLKGEPKYSLFIKLVYFVTKFEPPLGNEIAHGTSIMNRLLVLF